MSAQPEIGRRLPRGRKDRDAEQIRIDEEMVAGRDPLAHTAFRLRALPGPPKKPSGIQNRFVVGRPSYASFFDDLEAIPMEGPVVCG